MGYRDTSNYEPYGANYARPLRPYNMVQWAGVAFACLGLAIDFLYFAGRLGWAPAWVTKNPSLALPAIILGVVLINSRRDPAADLAPELAAQRRRWLIIVAAVCLPILGVAAVLALQGA